MYGRICNLRTLDNEALALVSKVALGCLHCDGHIVFARVGNEVNRCVIEGYGLCRGNLDCRGGSDGLQCEISIIDLLGEVELECSCDVLLLACSLDGHGEHIGIGILLSCVGELQAGESEHVGELEALLRGDIVFIVVCFRTFSLGEVEFGRLCKHEIATLVPAVLLALLC